MTEQPELDLGFVQQPDFAGKDLTIQEKFEAYHKLNPQVYRAYRSLAMQLLARGRKTMGIGMLTEILRWNYALQSQDPNSEFKISNDYRSRYARLLMRQEPMLEGVFNTKEIRTK